jgi:hypothetical protein
MTEFASFEDFFPYYVGQHSKPATRWFHFAGTHLGVASAMVGVARRKPKLIALAPVVSYGLAWFSHFTIERNKPATFGHPLWSFRGDFKMLRMMYGGRDAELTRIATDAKRLTVREGIAA